MIKTLGIHHITAIVNDPQRNIDFYAGVLGLRLVKKTVNFDRPEVYHLYFGNQFGEPGTIITFFPWPKLLKGRIGTGQVGVVSYMVPTGSFSFWEKRLEKFGIKWIKSIRFNKEYLQFQDPDGLQLELVEDSERSLNPWTFGDITSENAIKGFSGATLYSAQSYKTVDVLENILGLTCVRQENEYVRFTSEGTLGTTIDLKLNPPARGLMGAGTIHHIAWRAENDSQHKQWRDILLDKGYRPTEILDRNYFKALYFQEEGGILFEIATDPPGFTVDEPKNDLGKKLLLPSWLESKRKELEEKLPQIEVRVMEGE